MKKLFPILFAVLFLASCNKDYDAAMKSADKNYIIKVANAQYEKKKWKEALALYDRLPNLVAGTDDAAEVVFKSAYANYHDKNYKLAGHHFKNFASAFPQDSRREEAAYMAALSYYKGSVDYNLDQTETELALNELQDFLNNYPDTERAKNISQLVDELSLKLEVKAFENAKQYFKMAQYKAAVSAFENVLNDYPGTKLRPQIFDYLLRARSELAINSVFDLKQERLESAIAFTKDAERDFANTNLAKQAVETRNRLVQELAEHRKQQAEYEKRRAEILARQKAEELKKQQKEAN